MNAYKKLSVNVINSSVWCEDSDTKVVWITLLCLSDKDGIVSAGSLAIAKQAGVSREKVDAALGKFTAPDPESRDTAYEGRRVERCGGGWRLLNHDKYNSMRDMDARREYFKERQQKYTSKKKATKSAKAPVSPAEAPVESDAFGPGGDLEWLAVRERDALAEKAAADAEQSRQGVDRDDCDTSTFDDITGSKPKY